MPLSAVCDLHHTISPLIYVLFSSEDSLFFFIDIFQDTSYVDMATFRNSLILHTQETLTCSNKQEASRPDSSAV